MRFIAFERSSGHCSIDLLNGDNLTHALGRYLASRWKLAVDDHGWIRDRAVAEHPLRFVEREIKADPENDELAVDIDTCSTINEHSFEIRVLPEGALAASCATVFTSAEPGYTSGKVMIGRMRFARDYPAVDARAFFWYLRDGVLVTFFRLDSTEEGRKLDVVARYLVGDGDPWTAAPWSGTYEELADRMTFESPY